MRALILAMAVLAAAAAPAGATVLRFHTLARITGWATGRGVVGWQTPDGQLVMLRDGESARISFQLPHGCSLAAVARPAALVSCRANGNSIQRLFLPGAGLQEIPGLRPGEGGYEIGARWIVGINCDLAELHTGCPGFYLNWRTGRHVDPRPGAPRDLDSPDLRALPRERPRYTLELGDGLSVIAYRTSDRKRLTVRLPPGTVPDTSGATRDRAFIAAPIPGSKNLRLLEARFPA